MTRATIDLSTGDGQHPRLHFTSFDTESNFDYVYVYDGDGADWPQLGQFAGSGTPSDQVGSGDNLYIKFTADGSGERDGFAATFNCELGTGRRMMDLPGQLYENGADSPGRVCH